MGTRMTGNVTIIRNGRLSFVRVDGSKFEPPKIELFDASGEPKLDSYSVELTYEPTLQAREWFGRLCRDLAVQYDEDGGIREVVGHLFALYEAGQMDIENLYLRVI